MSEKSERGRNVGRLKKLLSDFSPRDILLLESADRQFVALKNLFKNLRNPEAFFKLTLINALLSYQLSMKGEEYWERFSEFFSESTGGFEEFIKRYNRRFLSAKLKRLRKAAFCVESLFKTFSLQELGKDLKLLVDFLSTCMGQDRGAKTIVFASKMFCYAYRIVTGRIPEGIEGITIPYDSRLSKIATKDEWQNLSRELGIPPVKLDSLVWIPMGMSREEIREKLPEPLAGKVLNLKKELEKLRKERT
ncbi:MAG: N-glycosylase/DNA lyase [Desulfurobacteriaceae bacterium]